MARIPDEYRVTKRTDSETYRLTISRTSGLPEYVCARWQRRSFQDFPPELAHLRHPKSKPDAKAAARVLIEYLKRLQEKRPGENVASTIFTLKEYAKGYFLEGAAHLKRWENKGQKLKPQTVAEHRRLLVNYLLPRFGDFIFSEIHPATVEDFLLEQDISNSYRNTIQYTLKLIMKEAKRDGIIDMIPEFEPFVRAGKRQNVLSGEELAALFPDDEKELIRIWKRPDDMRKERDEIALMFGTLFCVAASAGMRSGEIRALHKNQIHIPNSGLVVDRAIDAWGVIGPLKKSTPEDPRSQPVIIPDKTIAVLNRWFERNPECPDYPGLLFPYHGKPVTGYYVLDRFRWALDRLEIDHVARRLTVHCLRYTYNTKMKTILSRETLREFLGHRSEAMTELYDNPILLERLKELADEKAKVEMFWNQPTILNFKAS